MPRCASSARIRCGPWPFAMRERTKLSVKRASASAPDRSSSSSAGAMTSSGKPRAASLRVSSRRLCSRRASSSSAARLQAGSSTAGAALGLEGRTLLLGRHLRRHLDGALLRQELRADALLDRGRDVLVLEEEIARVLLALPDAVAIEAVPGAGLLDDVLLDAEIDDLAFARDTDPVQDLELGHLERRRDLVLDDLDARLAADDFLAFLDGARAADVEPHRGIELQRVAARRRLGVTEHHADLHADLVDEDDEGVRALDIARELAQCL